MISGDQGGLVTMTTPMASVCVHGPLRKLAGGRAERELDGETVVEPSA